MTTPFEKFTGWFGTLPQKYRQDLASEIAMLFPGMNVNPYHRKFLENFTGYLDDIRRKGASQEYGLVYCLKSLIERIIRAKNRKDEGWEKEKAELAEFAKLTGSCAVDYVATEKAMQSKQWEDIEKRWNELDLTEESLDEWLVSRSPSGSFLG